MTTYVTTRAILAGLPGSCLQKETIYRCKRCHKTTTSLRKMNKHVHWRWLTDRGLPK